MKCYQSFDDLEEAVRYLIRTEPRFAPIVGRHGVPSLRQAPVNLAGLLMIVTEQFLSLKAAAAIWLRIDQAIAPMTASAVLATSLDELKMLGLSAAKARSFHAIAAACVESRLRFDDFHALSDEEVRTQLMPINGIGPWTVDIYLLAVLQRCNAWPAGDLALQIAAQDLLQLDKRPTARQMAVLADNWRPYRAAAARLLWSHYRAMKRLTQAQ